MKYCCQYSTNTKIKSFQEVLIPYGSQDRELLGFLKKHSKQMRVVLVVESPHALYVTKGWELLNAIRSEHKDYQFAVCFGAAGRFSAVDEELKTCMSNLIDIPYFLGYTIVNFEQLHYILQFGVSDVYLAEGICFDLRRAKSLCKKHGVAIRAFANIAQSEVHDSAPLLKFFVRPEDVPALEQYIDVLEFWGGPDRQDVLLRIYSRGIWFGDLHDLILDFNLSLDSRRVAPDFAPFRANCGRECLTGTPCTFCASVLNVANRLEQEGLFIRQKPTD